MITEEQNKIINYFLEGDSRRILSVNSPPGTGKTFTAILTADKFVQNYKKNVLILTFSKNAIAQLLKTKDKYVINSNNKEIFIDNYHSFFYKYIVNYSNYLNLSNDIKIYTPKMKAVIILNRLKIGEHNMNISKFGNLIDNIMNAKLAEKNYKMLNQNSKENLPSLEQIKRISIEIHNDGILTFTELVYYFDILINKSGKLLNYLQKKFPLLILDEYQDSSLIQDKIVKKLIGDNNKALFFSDKRQMIYAWRHASEKRIDDLLKYYENYIETKKLSKNFRYGDKNDIIDFLNNIYKKEKIVYKNSENIKICKIKVDDKNMFAPKSRNKVYSKIFWKIHHILKSSDLDGISIGILVRKNELLKYIYKKFIEKKWFLHTLTKNEKELEYILFILDYINYYSECNIKREEDLNNLCKMTFELIFKTIYENKIASIRKSNLNCLTFKKLVRKRKKVLKKIFYLLNNFKNIKDLLTNLYSLLRESNLSVNKDFFYLLKKISKLNNINYKNIMNIYFQYRNAKVHKNLKGIYLLTMHQAKGRQFDKIIVVDINLNKSSNIYYVAMSRVKNQLFIINIEEENN